MDSVETRMRTMQGLRGLEGELRELVDMARFRSEADQRLFRIQLKRIRCKISKFESDLIDLLASYPEARDTAPLSRLLAERSVMRNAAALRDAPSACDLLDAPEPARDGPRLARLHAELAALNSELSAAPAERQPAIRDRIAATEREIRKAGM